MTGRQAFLWAIGQQESGGSYTAVNRSSGALGKYQVMPSNVAAWTKRALGRALTPQQFLDSPSAQEAVANTVLGGYYDSYGAAGAASAWYSGNPKLATSTAPQNGGPSVAGYVNSILAKMSAALGGSALPPSGGGPVMAQTAGFSLNPIKDGSSLAKSVLGLFDGSTEAGWVEGLSKDLGKLALFAVLTTGAAALVVIGLYTAAKGDGSKSSSGGGLFALPSPSSAAETAEADPELAAVAL